MTDQLGKRSWS